MQYSNGFFQPQWKLVQIIMIQKSAEIAESYKPIRLQPIETIRKSVIPKALYIITERQKIIPNFQFDFRCKHATMEQIQNHQKDK